MSKSQDVTPKTLDERQAEAWHELCRWLWTEDESESAVGEREWRMMQEAYREAAEEDKRHDMRGKMLGVSLAISSVGMIVLAYGGNTVLTLIAMITVVIVTVAIYLFVTKPHDLQ